MAVARGGLVLALAILLHQDGAALAQSMYEQRFGEPVDVSLEDLLQNPGQYENRAIRTRGRLDLSTTSMGGAATRYAMRDTFNHSVRLVPVSNIAMEFDREARNWLGHEIEITGVLVAASIPMASQPYDAGAEAAIIQFWGFVGPEDAGDPKKPISARDVTLESLVANPGKRDGETVRVVGKFRGRNLYGDLPGASQQKGADWVIKDDMFAVWVTGKKPKGSGWELDPTLKRDTGKWIEVVARPETRRGVTYLRAIKVSLTSAPSPIADAKAPPPPPERPRLPPVVVFTLPLDGEADVPPTSRFVVQFNKDMDKATFAGKVFLRYAGPRLPGDRAFDGVKLSYDDGRRALTVDPGDVLRPGRTVELLFLPGIADVDGLALVPRSASAPSAEAVEVLHFEIGT